MSSFEQWADAVGYENALSKFAGSAFTHEPFNKDALLYESTSFIIYGTAAGYDDSISTKTSRIDDYDRIEINVHDGAIGRCVSAYIPSKIKPLLGKPHEYKFAFRGSLVHLCNNGFGFLVTSIYNQDLEKFIYIIEGVNDGRE